MAAGGLLPSSFIFFAMLRFVLPIGSQDLVICSRKDYLIHLWKFCKAFSPVSSSTGQDYFRYRPRRDFIATN